MPLSPDTPLPVLQADATRAVRTYARGDVEPHEATALLRRIAELFVAARGHFFTRDGDPDWSGRTGAYRAWVTETLSAANIDRAVLGPLQNAVRYHIGNALRDLLPPEELAALGLRSTSPRERSVEKRASYTHVRALVGAGGAIRDPHEIADAAKLIDTTLRRIDRAAVVAIEDGPRADLRTALTGIAATLAVLIDAAGAMPA